MAFESIQFTVPGILAGASLTASQFCFVQLDTSAKAVLPPASGGSAVGVLQDTPAADQPCLIAGGTVSKVVAGASNVTAGSKVTCDTSGRAITAAAGTTILGVALEASAATGDLISIALMRLGTA